MKNKKWLTYTVGILLTLVVLAAVGGAGFRIGMAQNASFARPAFTHNFDGGRQAMQGNGQPAQGNSWNNDGNQAMQGNFHNNGGPQAMQGNFQNRGFDNQGNNRGGDRRGGFSPIFGLIHLALLGLLGWFGYKFVKKSGWRLSRVEASPVSTPAPVASEAPSVEVEETKESE